MASQIHVPDVVNHGGCIDNTKNDKCYKTFLRKLDGKLLPAHLLEVKTNRLTRVHIQVLMLPVLGKLFDLLGLFPGYKVEIMAVLFYREMGKYI